MVENSNQSGDVDGLLKIICAYPESTGLVDHLQIIKTEIMQFKPSRLFGILILLVGALFYIQNIMVFLI